MIQFYYFTWRKLGALAYIASIEEKQGRAGRAVWKHKSRSSFIATPSPNLSLLLKSLGTGSCFHLFYDSVLEETWSYSRNRHLKKKKSLGKVKNLQTSKTHEFASDLASGILSGEMLTEAPLHQWQHWWSAFGISTNFPLTKQVRWC